MEGEYDKLLGQLSSLTQNVRTHTGNPRNQWDLMDRYLQVRPLMLRLNRDEGMCCLMRVNLVRFSSWRRPSRG
jgi:hypothetical protein